MNNMPLHFSQLTPDDCWQIVLDRDATYDDVFVTAVRTTGIYCRPDCPARKPKRQNVVFYATCTEAEAAGFRACKRCRPNERDFEITLVEAVCQHIHTQHTQSLTLDQLSAYANVSPTHLHRIFKRILGITPRQYADACRLQTLLKCLRTGETITAAAFAAGYGSSSRVYEHVPTQIGMTPAEYQSGGQGIFIEYSLITSSLGSVVIALTRRGVCAVHLSDGKDTLRSTLEAELPLADLHLVSPERSCDIADILADLEVHPRSQRLSREVQVIAYRRRVTDALREFPNSMISLMAQPVYALADGS